MKTLHTNQTGSALLNATSNKTVKNQRPTIGDDDGITDRTMSALIVLFMVLIMMVSFGSSIAQESVKYRILLRQAMLDMDRLEYDKALIKLLEVRANTEENANVNHMLGLCYLHGLGATEQAVFYLSLATPHISYSHEKWDLDEKNSPPECAYYLAMAYEQKEDYARAAEFYSEFLSGMQTPDKPNTSRTFAIISSRTEQCKLAAAKQAAEDDHQNIVLNK